MNGVLKLLRSRFEEPSTPMQDTNLMIRTLLGSTPLVLDSPHSGTQYPADFGHACDPLVLRRAEDTHVDKLFSFAPALGAAWVEALFPRSYLDTNRGLTEVDRHLLDAEWPGVIDPPGANAKVRLGKGLIWRLTDDGEPIYGRLLSVEEVRHRIDTCWIPYHDALANAISNARATHGFCIHVNCHSMPAVASSHATEYPGLAHADFVIGDRDGTTASPVLSDLVCQHLRGLGFTVSYNHPYKGVEIVKRHGKPTEHCHSVQLEINRKLYMDEGSLEIKPEFSALQTSLHSLVEMLSSIDIPHS
ncbi:MAG: N-formylglutamate amidohydrolase [Burkholderiaceae bacterium]|nr:N-formylglutamate amidohydrolase [Burkholderiaceae bacterium]